MLDHEQRIVVLNVFQMTVPAPASSKGFTLIELMIVLVIVSLAAALGLPSYRTWVQNTQIYNAAESVQNGLQKARAEAVKRNATIEFVLGTNPPWLIQLHGNGLACPIVPGTTLTTLLECSTTEGIKKVNSTSTPPNSYMITFNSLGGIVANLPDANGNVPATITQIDFDSPTLTGSRNLRITIGAGGIVKLCYPDPSAPNNKLSTTDPRRC
jgi:type IV fimbrial biogenesis protein FimT